MATDGLIGRRRALAVLRIEAACQLLSGGRKLNLPKFSRYGQDMLLVFQLETLADFLEILNAPAPKDETDHADARQSLTEAQKIMGINAQDADNVNYEDLTNKELAALIAARGLDKGKARSHADLQAILEAADNAAEMAIA